jgi:biofilm PGA synthesis N-glycosyltransferase PgaC
MIEFAKDGISFLLAYSFYYPLFMAYLWMAGALYYYSRHERRTTPSVAQPPLLAAYPRVSIVIPCFNEADNARDTIEYALTLVYPDFEVIAVDDGSRDGTARILDELALRHPRLRIVHLAQNQGKAMALNTGAMLADSEFLICIDGDALLDRHAVTWLMLHFQTGPRVAAVTGNPRIRNRTTLLGKIQVGEFSSIIGLIKRAQRTYGRLFTVSGVLCAFRKTALHQVGYWSTDMLTEDIDISWKLEVNHWDVRFEPNALVWILMPETVRGLWRQRLRWAMGGTQVLRKNFDVLKLWRKRRMWPVYVEYSLSVFWAYTMLLVFVLWTIGQFVDLPDEIHIVSLLPGWSGVVIGFTCLLQFAVSTMLDKRYDPPLWRNTYWMIWYPLVYWVINVASTIVAVPRALRRASGERARWISPDRGVVNK